ncbi:MAG: formate dehydrogenase accessory sulfurtransferase FdhD [Gammaproteobacteria bacterium]|nr:formate dehydrogenase accessory sulfurtransferase FdhD [Gammaproteobacteria bacterium]
MSSDANNTASRPAPVLSSEGLSPTYSVMATDEYGEQQEKHIAGERPLTIYVNKKEIVTLMTLGTQPEALVLGYLRNQAFIDDIAEIKSVQVDWETESAAITTHNKHDWEEKLSKRTVTSGCGQGTVFGNMMEQLENIRFENTQIKQSVIYDLLDNISKQNEIYKRAGGVHGCALCKDDQQLIFVEDVGRHNAVDTICGLMWLDNISGENKTFYTTGRLTSEMVIKVAQMGVPVILSRSGVTHMGFSLAQQLGVTLIARAKGKHFLAFNGSENISFDQTPDKKPHSHKTRQVSHS